LCDHIREGFGIKTFVVSFFGLGVFLCLLKHMKFSHALTFPVA